MRSSRRFWLAMRGPTSTRATFMLATRLLLPRYAGRPLYMLRAVSSEIGATLLLEPLSVDSARAEWSAGQGPGR